MSNKTNCNQKHLTISDRIFIEQELLRGSSFRSIASVLHKDPSTISKEIRRSSETVPAPTYNLRCDKCKYRPSCTEKHVCGSTACRSLCKSCHRKDPTLYCMYFNLFRCDRLTKPPYVCNNCSFRHCHLERRYYSARKAQRLYEQTLSESRKGINLTSDELEQLNDLISPLVLKGQPLSHIFAVHSDEIPCSRRTLYNYFDQHVFHAKNIDLPRRVRYKKRRSPKSNAHTHNYSYRNRRTYKDFERFMDAHPDTEVVEMDTVKGTNESGKCLLTLLFRNSNFMIVILLPQCTQNCVIQAINTLTDTLSLRLFRKAFPVILTDNGAEFQNPYSIEKTADGKQRSYVFYCDPYVSNQKARLEKNHEYIRYVIPKGQSMQQYTQEDITLLASHINSTARDSLNGYTPFDLAELLLDKRIPVLTGQHKVSPDEVMLKPALLKK